MIDENKLIEKALERVRDNLSLEKQIEFFVPVIALHAPVMPDVWHGGGRTDGTDYKSVRLCWWNTRNDRAIELVLYDTFAGSLFVDGRKTSIKSLVSLKDAASAFEAAFRYVFGE